MVGRSKQGIWEGWNCFATRPLLQYPDPGKKYHLHCDASDHTLGTVLQQPDDNSELCPISYASRQLKGGELNYSTTEKGCLAIIFTVGHFRPYLYSQPFALYTDHTPITYLILQKSKNRRLNQWQLQLQEYNYEIKYVSFSKNTVRSLQQKKSKD